MRKLSILASAMALAVSAHAGVMTADFGYDLLRQVSFSTSAGNFTENTARIYGTRTGGDDTILPHPNYTFDSYCVELGQNIWNASFTHTVTNLAGSQTDTGAPFAPVNFDTNRTAALSTLWGSFTVAPTADAAAAFQLAQWELCFDTDLTLASANTHGSYGNAGFMWADVSNDAIAASAESMLSQIRNGQVHGHANLALLSNPSYQDQIVRIDGGPGHTPGNPTPEPFTMSLGLASAGLFVRRRNAKKA